MGRPKPGWWFAAALTLAGAATAAVVWDPLCFTLKRGEAPKAFWKSWSMGSSRAAQPRYPEACVLLAVSRHMGIRLRQEIPTPRVRYESRTPLSEFQDAVEPQWGMRPDVFLNAFIEAKNEIYIMDEAEYYERMRRFVDDSLAHEYVHFLQVRYQGASLAGDTDMLEGDAVAVQEWFRETYMSGASDPCN